MAKKKQESYANKKAVIYARYSSHAQSDASIEQQIEKCTAYANKHGLEVIATYADRAMTGKNDHRPDFQRMLKDAEKGKFQVVVAWKSNRMGRNMTEALLNHARLLDNDVVTKYVEEDFDDSAAGRFSLRNMMNLNQFYSENMAEDIYRGLEDAAKQGRTIGHIPLGYKRDPETGKYIIDEVTAPIVREIFERFDKGEYMAWIIDDFNERGLRTSRGYPYNKSSFRKLLANRRYIGEYQWSDIIIPDGMPRIIEQGLFDRVQERLKFRGEVRGRRHDSMDFLLSGKLFCGHCGAQMTGRSGTSKNGSSHYYYVCRTQHIEHTCDKKSVRKDVIENAVAKALVEQVLSRNEVIEWMADSVMKLQTYLQEHSQVEYYEQKLAESRKSLNNLTKAVETGITGETIANRIKELETECREYLSLIAEEQKSIPHFTRDMVMFYLEEFRRCDLKDAKQKRALFQEFLERVDLYDDGHMNITFRYTDNDNELPVTFDDTSNVDNSSPKDFSEPLKDLEANTSLQFNGKRFVLTVPFWR